jgi:peptide/nickel transport system permease protein
MSFKPILLWSDALILLLLALVLVGVWLVRHNETFRGPCARSGPTRWGLPRR